MRGTESFTDLKLFYLQTLMQLINLPDPPKAVQLRLESTDQRTATLIWSTAESNSKIIEHNQRMAIKQTSPMGKQQESQEAAEISKEQPSNVITGFELRYRSEAEPLDIWETVLVSAKQRRHTLSNLLCGSRYAAKVTAFNDIASGQASEELRFSTQGSREYIFYYI